MDSERWVILDMVCDVVMDRDGIMAEVGDLVVVDDFRHSDRLGIIPVIREEDFELGEHPLAQRTLLPEVLLVDWPVSLVQRR